MNLKEFSQLLSRAVELSETAQGLEARAAQAKRTVESVMSAIADAKAEDEKRIAAAEAAVKDATERAKDIVAKAKEAAAKATEKSLASDTTKKAKLLKDIGELEDKIRDLSGSVVVEFEKISKAKSDLAAVQDQIAAEQAKLDKIRDAIKALAGA